VIRDFLKVFLSLSFDDLSMLVPLPEILVRQMSIAYNELYRPIPIDPVALQVYDERALSTYYLLDEVTQYLNLPNESKHQIRELGRILQTVWVLRGFQNPHYIGILLSRLEA
jgi:hypothetical protein